MLRWHDRAVAGNHAAPQQLTDRGVRLCICDASPRPQEQESSWPRRGRRASLSCSLAYMADSTWVRSGPGIAVSHANAASSRDGYPDHERLEVQIDVDPSHGPATSESASGMMGWHGGRGRVGVRHWTGLSGPHQAQAPGPHQAKALLLWQCTGWGHCHLGGPVQPVEAVAQTSCHMGLGSQLWV